VGRRSGCGTYERRARGSFESARGVEEFRARELAEDEKVPVLRAYLKRSRFEVGVFFEGKGSGSTDEELRSIAPATLPSRFSRLRSSSLMATGQRRVRNHAAVRSADRQRTTARRCLCLGFGRVPVL
jgi:hypothetical protein